MQPDTQVLTDAPVEFEESERSFRLLVQGVTDYAIFMLDTHGRVSSWNAGAERIKGYTRSEIIGEHFSRFYTHEAREANLPQKALETAAGSGRFEAEGWRLRKDGSRFWAGVVIDAIHDEDGNLIGFAKITRDLTERRKVEEKMRQIQKMEAVGQLTSGIAHDFNNLLTIILGNLELLGRMVSGKLNDEQGRRAERFIATAMDAGRRGATLTRRLLSFARQQAFEPEPVDVNRLVYNVTELLARTLGEAVKIRTELALGVGFVLADLAELESALLNLAVNARDAMPDGGSLVFETSIVDPAAIVDEREDLSDGPHVLITVSDSGMGMTPEVLARVFEPFFTTKEAGRGTGLGLSQVYGFVKQTRGHIAIDSAVGHGTSVKIYLPQAVQPALGHKRGSPGRDFSIAADEAGTILLVEDDDAVRRFSAEVLWSLGYSVLEAPHARAALEILDAREDVRLLFTDIGLPGLMDGWELSDEVRQRRPELKVLVTTAYLRSPRTATRRNDPSVSLIAKPFSVAELSAKIQDIMGS